MLSSRAQSSHFCESLAMEDAFLGVLQPEFLGVSDARATFDQLRYPKLTVRDVDFFESLSNLRRCYQCGFMAGKDEFPPKHWCGGCKSIAFCSKMCYSMCWNRGHHKTCTRSDRYRLVHSIVDKCVNSYLLLNQTGDFQAHMRKHFIKSRLFLVLGGEDKILTFIPIKRKLISCFPIPDASKEEIKQRLNENDRIQLIVTLQSDADIEFVISQA